MTQISDRYRKLIQKDQELEKLFELAAKRRKKLLQQRNDNTEMSSFDNVSGKSYNKYILKPLRSSDDLVKIDTDHNQVEVNPRFLVKNLQRNYAYHSHQNLPETNLDSEDTSLHKLNSSFDNNNFGQEDTARSTENLNKTGHHNPSFVTYSSSSDEVDISNYCQFIPATSSSTNTTTSSHYSRTDNSGGIFSSLEPSSSDPGVQPTKDTETGSTKQTATVCYPSRSPLIDQRYQGSPVVRIDNKLRAEEAVSQVNRSKPPIGKPPLMPRYQKLSQKPMTNLVTSETRLSHSILADNIDCDKVPCSMISKDNPNLIPSSIILRTKKKLLEEHMRKRFSVGDYSTRSLIEWENNLNSETIVRMSLSGDLQSAKEVEEFSARKLSSQSDALLSLDIIASARNFSSEVNIVHCNSADSFKDPQVSFSLKNQNQGDEKTSYGDTDRLFKRSNFIQRSMNDIAAALRNVRSSEKVQCSKRFMFPSRTHFMNQSLFRKRDSTSSDLLYSIPPFARQHLPPDISGATKIISQGPYQNPSLPSSTPNLIAELDPTFHERYPTEVVTHDVAPTVRNPLSKRNRSYRLSFIENADTVTTKKLTAASATTSPLNAAVPRFVQPRRRMPSRNSGTVKRHESPKTEARNSRTRNSNRFSCAQQ